MSITGGSDIAEGGDAEFTITAGAAHPDAPAADLSVNVSIEVTGDYGVTTESETVTVSPGGSVTLTIATTDDSLDELDGSIAASLETGDGYTVSSTQGSATINVADNDLPKPVVSITGGSDIAEGGDAEFTITAGAAHPDAPAADLSVNVSIEVTGDYGVTTESETVTVSPGGSVTLTIATTDDSLDELDGSIAASLETGDGYTVSSTQGCSHDQRGGQRRLSNHLRPCCIRIRRQVPRVPGDPVRGIRPGGSSSVVHLTQLRDPRQSRPSDRLRSHEWSASVCAGSYRYDGKGVPQGGRRRRRG